MTTVLRSSRLRPLRPGRRFFPTSVWAAPHNGAAQTSRFELLAEGRLANRDRGFGVVGEDAVDAELVEQRQFARQVSGCGKVDAVGVATDLGKPLRRCEVGPCGTRSLPGSGWPRAEARSASDRFRENRVPRQQPEDDRKPHLRHASTLKHRGNTEKERDDHACRDAP